LQGAEQEKIKEYEKMNMQINQAMDQAWERRKLVAGALKTAHVYRKCADYEDLFQEGLIVYAQCLQEND
jgi:hypothetical protein